jgi:hypothetical protein
MRDTQVRTEAQAEVTTRRKQSGKPDANGHIAKRGAGVVNRIDANNARPAAAREVAVIMLCV